MRNLWIAALISDRRQDDRRGVVEGRGSSPSHPKPAQLLFRVGAMILVAFGVGLAVDHLVHLVTH